MIFNRADDISLVFFSLFALLMFTTINYVVWRGSYQVRKFVIIFLAYLILFCSVVQSGAISQNFVPIGPLLFLSVLVGAIVFSYSRYGTRLLESHSFAMLIGFQCFRFPLELILHHWATIETIPETMTWTGQNWDIVTGLVSFIAIPFVNGSKAVVWTVQILGFVLLLNVLRVVVLSSPLPFAWPLANPLQLIAYLPYALIGPLFVGPALAWHLMTFRKLF